MSERECLRHQRTIDDVGDLDRLPPAVARHVESCGECERFGRDLVRLRTLLREPERVAAPSDFDAQLARRLRVARETRPPRAARIWSFLPEHGLATAAALAVLLLGVSVTTRVMDSPEPAETIVATNTPIVSPAPAEALVPPPAEIETPVEGEAPVAVATGAPSRTPVVRSVAPVSRPGNLQRRASEPRDAMILVSDANGSRVVAVPEVLVGAEQLVPAGEIGDTTALATRTVSF